MVAPDAEVVLSPPVRIVMLPEEVLAAAGDATAALVPIAAAIARAAGNQRPLRVTIADASPFSGAAGA
jgi:hypothetical protein